MKKVYIILAVCLAGILCFAGCAQQNSGTPTEATQGEATTQAATTQAEAATQAEATTQAEAATQAETTAQATSGEQTATGEGPNLKYAEPITITGVRPANALTMADLDFEDNPWTKLYLDNHNIILKYLWIVDNAKYDERVNLSIASGEMPDFARVTDIQFQQLYEAGLTSDVQDVYDNYSTDITKEFISEHGQIVFDASSRNGRLQAIPFTVMTKEGAPSLIINSDWLEKAGMEAINSVDDLETLIQKASEMQFGGVSYSFPLTSDLGLFKTFAAMFNSYPTIWITLPDGTLGNGAVQPETRDALLKFQEWYKNGWLDPEFGTKDSGKFLEDITAGKVGINAGGFGAALYQYQSLKNNQPDFELSFFPMPCVNGNFKSPHNVGILGYWVINPKCEHPEAFSLMMNWWMKIFYTSKDAEEGRTYINGDDGSEIWDFAFPQAYRAFKNYDQSVSIKNWLEGTESFEDLTADTKNVADSITRYQEGDNSMWAWANIYPPNKGFTGVEAYLKYDGFIVNSFYGAPTETMMSKREILQKLIDETYTNIIRGADISTFDNMVTQWNALGGADMTDEVNEWNRNK